MKLARQLWLLLIQMEMVGSVVPCSADDFRAFADAVYAPRVRCWGKGIRGPSFPTCQVRVFSLSLSSSPLLLLVLAESIAGSTL